MSLSSFNPFASIKRGVKAMAAAVLASKISCCVTGAPFARPQEKSRQESRRSSAPGHVRRF